jgi:hypothetical protein
MSVFTFTRNGLTEVIVFDATTSESHTQDADVTENPVETGSAITDNVRAKPAQLKLETLVTDYPVGLSGWGSSTGLVPDCYVYDRRFPKVFYVYPGAKAADRVHAHWAADPPDVQIEGQYGAADGSNTPISIDDVYVTALVDYLQMRAHAKDTDAQDLVRSGQDYSRFLNRLGLKLQVDRAMDPNTNSPPPPPEEPSDGSSSR